MLHMYRKMDEVVHMPTRTCIPSRGALSTIKSSGGHLIIIGHALSAHNSSIKSSWSLRMLHSLLGFKPWPFCLSFVVHKRLEILMIHFDKRYISCGLSHGVGTWNKFQNPQLNIDSPSSRVCSLCMQNSPSRTISLNVSPLELTPWTEGKRLPLLRMCWARLILMKENAWSIASEVFLWSSRFPRNTSRTTIKTCTNPLSNKRMTSFWHKQKELGNMNISWKQAIAALAIGSEQWMRAQVDVTMNSARIMDFISNENFLFNLGSSFCSRRDCIEWQKWKNSSACKRSSPSSCGV